MKTTKLGKSKVNTQNGNKIRNKKKKEDNSNNNNNIVFVFCLSHCFNFESKQQDYYVGKERNLYLTLVS
jgi:hypothetical protein